MKGITKMEFGGQQTPLVGPLNILTTRTIKIPSIYLKYFSFLPLASQEHTRDPDCIVFTLILLVPV